MKNKIIMKEVCMIFIEIHMNIKLKYKKKRFRQTAGKNPKKSENINYNCWLMR